MKVQILRVSALGIVLVLGVVAIVQLQRASRPTAMASESASVVSLAGGEAARTPANPLRKETSVAAADPFVRRAGSEAPAEAPTGPAIQVDDGIPNAAALGLSTAGSAGAAPTPTRLAAREPAPSRSLEVPAADKPADRPTASPYPARAAATDRYTATTDDRYASQARSGPPAALPAAIAGDEAEPAQLRADPFAAPARTASEALPTGRGASWPPAGGRGIAAEPFPVGNTAREPLPPSPLPGPRGTVNPADNLSTDSLSASEGSGRPGGKSLEGPQTPQLTIQKIAPSEIQVGKPAPFKIAVRNTGAVIANGVEVHDQLPKGTQFVSSNPRAQRGAKGDLVWTLGTVRPGEEVSVEVQLMPLAEGEIGSVATVQFTADASARCVATRPQLVVETQMPNRVQIGEEVPLKITVSNPGTGMATGVVIKEWIPAGLQHPAGPELEYEVGNLKPGESRKLDLVMIASKAGSVTNMLAVRGDGNLLAEDRKSLDVTAPALEIGLEGPKKRYLEREAVYQVSISNPGTATAQKVDLVAYLPTGLKFVSTNNSGVYDAANRAVHWRLEELPANERGTVELVTLPVEPGSQSIKFHSSAQRGVTAEKEHPVVIEGIAAILFQVSNTADPLPVGGQTTFDVRVLNQGSKAASNVCVSVLLPQELKPLAADGPTRNLVEGNRITFEGLASLAPKAEMTYRVRVQALKAGDLRTRIQLMTDDMQTPVTKEESSRVYADE